MIKSVNLKNFKCFQDELVNFSPLTLLSGLNGMGKSTVIQALLLLRQSYDENVLNKGISLNGELINIGTGKDLLFERAEEPEQIYINILVNNDVEYWWQMQYNSKSNFLNLVDSNTPSDLELLSLFNDHFQYLCAERIGPRNTFPKSNFKVVEHRQLGLMGEYTQHYLHVYGRENISNINAKVSQVEELDLISQVQGWMNLISPGVKITIQDYSQADLVGLEYKYIDNEVSNEYRSTNVGFGITYVLPVIVALLKAEKGDLVVIENPEAHLHPKGQRTMGELISKVASGGVQVIIESHSDHVLNGIRLSVRKKILENDSVKINFFEKICVNNQYIHRSISPNIKDDGKIDYWPNDFFDEWDKALDEFF